MLMWRVETNNWKLVVCSILLCKSIKVYHRWWRRHVVVFSSCPCVRLPLRIYVSWMNGEILMKLITTNSWQVQMKLVTLRGLLVAPKPYTNVFYSLVRSWKSWQWRNYHKRREAAVSGRRAAGGAAAVSRKTSLIINGEWLIYIITDIINGFKSWLLWFSLFCVFCPSSAYHTSAHTSAYSGF